MEISLLALAFLGGVLTILSPCILPVIPLIFARTGRSFRGEVLPMLLGLAIAFSAAAMVATATARWLLAANEVGRYAALLLLALVGLALLSPRVAEWLARPMARAGASLSRAPQGNRASVGRNVVIGAAIGLLWAPCAGPILGLLIAGAAVAGPVHAATLFFTFAVGAAMSLAAVTTLGGRLVRRLRSVGAADRIVRRTLGAATLATVLMLLLGWDRSLFAGATVVRTTRAEEQLIARLAPGAVGPIDAGMSLDAFAAGEAAGPVVPTLAALDAPLPGFDGATVWINSAPLTPASLRGKVVLVDFWTFGCYNCLNALPHVKALYAKYRDRGFVVVGVHTPEFARERVVDNVRREVAQLDVQYPVVVDNDSRIWRAFHNQYWPAAYYADASGTLRFYHFGEGRYAEQDSVVAKLLAERDAVVARGGR